MPLSKVIKKELSRFTKFFKKCDVCDKRSPDTMVTAIFTTFSGSRYQEDYHLHDACASKQIENPTNRQDRAISYYHQGREIAAESNNLRTMVYR